MVQKIWRHARGELWHLDRGVRCIVQVVNGVRCEGCKVQRVQWVKGECECECARSAGCEVFTVEQKRTIKSFSYHSISKTHVRDRIFKSSPVHASVIIRFTESAEFSESSASFRKTSIEHFRNYLMFMKYGWKSQLVKNGWHYPKNMSVRR